MLDHGDEGELHGLAQLVARVRALRRIGNALQAEVGVGFEPSNLAGRLDSRHAVGWRALRFRQHSACAGATGEGV